MLKLMQELFCCEFFRVKESFSSDLYDVSMYTGDSRGLTLTHGGTYYIEYLNC